MALDAHPLLPYETYDPESPGDLVRTAQRVTLLYLSKGDELWVAVAKATGIDPGLATPEEELRCTRLGVRWMEDPEIEEITSQLQRAATAGLRLLRLRAVQRVGKELHSDNEKASYRAAVDILKSTEPPIPETSPKRAQAPGLAGRRSHDERERLKARMKAKQIVGAQVTASQDAGPKE